jgi:hypothetical protein
MGKFALITTAAIGATVASPAVAAALLLSTAGHAAPASNHQFAADGDWIVHYAAEDGEVLYCYMRREFRPTGNAKAAIEINYSSGYGFTLEDAFASLIIENPALSNLAGDPPVEIWFDRKGDSPADARATASVHKDQDGSYLSVDIQDSVIQRLASANTLTMRVAGGSLDTYPVGPALTAVRKLVDCDHGVKPERWGVRP